MNITDTERLTEWFKDNPDKLDEIYNRVKHKLNVSEAELNRRIFKAGLDCLTELMNENK